MGHGKSIFFFNQKTAYDVRISDWSSDVCSSDLLFTAIARLRAVQRQIAQPLADGGIALYSQHVDGLDTGTLVDIFRAEEDSCLLGTDAVRDGVDVPGRALRLIAFDRVPWPRPDIIHKARREVFGEIGRAHV